MRFTQLNKRLGENWSVKLSGDEHAEVREIQPRWAAEPLDLVNNGLYVDMSPYSVKLGSVP